MTEIFEWYGKAKDKPNSIEFWQAQGPEAIFDAAYELIMDYYRIREGHAKEPRLDRTVGGLFPVKR